MKFHPFGSGKLEYVLTDSKVDEIVEQGAASRGYSQEDLNAICDQGGHEWELALTVNGVVNICLICGARD